MTNHWHERFLTDDYVYGKDPNAFLTEVIHTLPPKAKILCIAEGEGRNAVYLAQQGFEVTAWDYAPSGLQKTKRLAKEKGVSVKTACHDLEQVTWEPEAWDAVVHIFGHVPPDVLTRTWAGIRTTLKPGGFYISEMYTKEQLHYSTGGPKDIAMLIDPKMVLETFEEEFIAHFYVGEVLRIEGQLHTGMAHVVQLVCQKRASSLID